MNKSYSAAQLRPRKTKAWDEEDEGPDPFAVPEGDEIFKLRESEKQARRIFKQS